MWTRRDLAGRAPVTSMRPCAVSGKGWLEVRDLRLRKPEELLIALAGQFRNIETRAAQANWSPDPS